MINLRSKYIQYFFIVAFIILVVFLSLISLRQIKKNTEKQIGESLQTVLHSSREALHQWLDRREKEILKLASDPKLVEFTEKLIRMQNNNEPIVGSETLRDLRNFVHPTLVANNDQGIFIITKDYISIASMRNANIGNKNLMAIQRPELVKKVFNGLIQLIPPIRSDVPLAAGRMAAGSPDSQNPQEID